MLISIVTVFDIVYDNDNEAAWQIVISFFYYLKIKSLFSVTQTQIKNTYR